MSDACVRLTGSLIPLTTLAFREASLPAIREDLARRQSEAPALFRNLPCVLDLTRLEVENLDLDALYESCREFGLLPIGVRNVAAHWDEQLARLGLADLGKNAGRRQGAVTDPSTEAPGGHSPEPEPPAPRALKVHVGNIRSGQQLYFDGDLVVQGMVNPGAEILATGDIHVYGALRGRVLAGVKGDQSALIGCQQFDAELVAIAGEYRLFDDEHPHENQAVLIRLDDGTLNINSV